MTTKVEGFRRRALAQHDRADGAAGEPLFDLYSPELVASQEEYLRALQSAAELPESSLPEVQRGGAELAAAARGASSASTCPRFHPGTGNVWRCPAHDHVSWRRSTDS